MKIKDYLFNKLFFPKVVNIDKPGLIISKTSKKYGKPGSKRRIVLYFEDLFVKLQLDTTKILGKKKTQELWYKIGKDVGTRYILLAHTKTIPKIILPKILEYIFKYLETAGMSSIKVIEFNKEFIILKGEVKKELFFRKSNDNSYLTGFISAIISKLTGENIEAQYYKEDKQYIIKVDKHINKIYNPKIKKLEPLKEYSKINFNISNSNSLSFSDIIRFNKIIIGKDNKLTYQKMTIFPAETGMMGLVAKNYEEIKREDILKNSLIKCSKEIGKEIFKHNMTIKQKIKLMNSIFSGFGIGISNVTFNEKEVEVKIKNPPINRYGFLFDSLIINGYLNSIFNKKIKLIKIKKKNLPLTYTLNFKM